MANGWTLERRERQSVLIRTWRPWEKSTGARTAEGKAKVSRNAYKGAERAKLRALMREVGKVLGHQRHFIRGGVTRSGGVVRRAKRDLRGTQSQIP